MKTYLDFVHTYEQIQAQAKLQSLPLTQTVLDLCVTVNDAKNSLQGYDWTMFTRKTGLADTKEHRLKQMVTVARSAAILREHAAALPPTLQALSHLTRLDKDGLTAHVQAGQIHPLLSVSGAQTLVSVYTKRKKNRGRPDIVDVPKVTDQKEPPTQDLSVAIASIGIIGDGLRYPSLIAFLKELDAFVKDAASRYDCVDPRIRLSKDLKAVMAVRAPSKAA